MYCAKFLEGKQIMVAEKMQYKSHLVYPPGIIQTILLGKLQIKSLEYNDCLYAVSMLKWNIKKPPTDHAPSLQNYFQTNCRSVTQH